MEMDQFEMVQKLRRLLNFSTNRRKPYNHVSRQTTAIIKIQNSNFHCIWKEYAYAVKFSVTIHVGVPFTMAFHWTMVFIP